MDYVAELADRRLYIAYYIGRKKGRDRADKPEYKVKMSAALLSNR